MSNFESDVSMNEDELKPAATAVAATTTRSRGHSSSGHNKRSSTSRTRSSSRRSGTERSSSRRSTSRSSSHHHNHHRHRSSSSRHRDSSRSSSHRPRSESSSRHRQHHRTEPSSSSSRRKERSSHGGSSHRRGGSSSRPRRSSSSSSAHSRNQAPEEEPSVLMSPNPAGNTFMGDTSLGGFSAVSTISEITNPLNASGILRNKASMPSLESRSPPKRETIIREKSAVGFDPTTITTTTPTSSRSSASSLPKRAGSRDNKLTRSQSVRTSTSRTHGLSMGSSSHGRNPSTRDLIMSPSGKMRQSVPGLSMGSSGGSSDGRRSGGGSRRDIIRESSRRSLGLSMGSSYHERSDGLTRSQSARMPRSSKSTPDLTRLQSARHHHSGGSSRRKLGRGASSRGGGSTQETEEMSRTSDTSRHSRRKTKRRMNRELNSSRRRKSSRNLNTRRIEHSGAIDGDRSPSRKSSPAPVLATNAGSFGNRLGMTLLYEPPEEEKEIGVVKQAAPEDKKDEKKSKRRCFGKKKEDDAPTTNTRQLRGASTIAGRKAIDFKVLYVAGDIDTVYSIQQSSQAGGYVDLSKIARRPKTFEPKHLLAIERGAAVLITSKSLVKHHRFQDLGEDGAVVVTMKGREPLATEDVSTKDGPQLKKLIKSKDIRDLDFESEVGRIERFKLSRLRRKMIRNLDGINCLRLSRQLQYYMPLQSVYEAYLISQLIQALEGKLKDEETNFVLDVAFKSRNISRIISKIVGPNFDFSDHDHQIVSWGRLSDMATHYPLIGIPQLPATENWMPLRNYIPWLASGLVHGGKEVYTSNQEGLSAQNMSPEMNGFELANRNRFGTYAGRLKTNEFRSENRFPIDQEMVESFLARPIPTMVDYGLVHTLRVMSQHWSKMTSKATSQFANNLMEQLDPFETMRVYMPTICIAVSSFRGRSSWDGVVLAPFVRKCQELKPAFTADKCRSLINEMKEKIVLDLCAGIPSICDPLNSWLDSLMTACFLIEEEARQVYQKVTTVEIGLRLGYDLVTQVNFEIPSDADMLSAILLHLQGKSPGKDVRERSLRDAMNLMTPRDKRTLLELVKKNQVDSKPAKLLLDRSRSLLKQVLRREYFSEAIRHLSTGEFTEDIYHDEWYWVIEGETKGVYIYNEDDSTNDADCFVHVDSGVSQLIDLDDDSVKFRTYIPIAESISRAQRCYMNIALDHGKTFRYNAFMEFSFLRTALRQLAVVSQIFCEELDDARMTIMREVQRANQESIAVRDMKLGDTYYIFNEEMQMYEPFSYENECSPGDPEWSRLTRAKIVKSAPQNMVLVGGGPDGLLTVIHSAETVLASGGVIKLYSMSKERTGIAFEKAEIVRLDQRWIAMLRYYLGTAFADAFVPTSETDAVLGNVLPTQGYLEVTMKDLENLLHLEVSKLWSRGVLQVYTDADAQYDSESNALTKLGEHLKQDDMLLRKINGDGKKSDHYHSWRVIDLIEVEALGLEDIRVGQEYGVYVRLKDAVLPFKLSKVDLQTRTYTFESLSEGNPNLVAAAHNLPAVYPKGTTKHGAIESVVIECIEESSSGERRSQEIPMKRVSGYKFTLDLQSSHVIECIGKPADSTTHLSTTTSEPYGMCCLQGFKVSLMHNFGVTAGNAENTTIGDSAKMVRLQAIAKCMFVTIKRKHWKMHFLKILGASVPLLEQLIEAVKDFEEKSKTFRRQTLHARFFETCDNFYMGMELAHGYENWKNRTAAELSKGIDTKVATADDKSASAIAHHIDRLWFQSSLDVIREAGVYDPAAYRRLPQLYLVDSYSNEDLRDLDVGDAFKVDEKPGERYEVVVKSKEFIFVRSVNGHMTRMKLDRQVCRQSDLTRSADGVSESSVAVSTFPVEQFVNHRSARVNNESGGYVFAFIGDEQATSHFMRSSQRTGGCINAMLVNDFLKGAIDGKPFLERLRQFCTQTDVSNGRVVESSISSNHALDGFLRLGFTHKEGIDYLYAKVMECRESGQDVNDALSPDWKSKFAAPMVPRGMELNEKFIASLLKNVRENTIAKFMSELENDKLLATETLMEILLSRKEEMERNYKVIDHKKYWSRFLNGIEEDLTEAEMEELKGLHCDVARKVEQNAVEIVEYAKKESLYNERLPSEFFNQPKALDAFIDDSALESQTLAETFVSCAGIAAASLACTLLFSSQGLNVFIAAVLAVINVILSAGIMINVSRYKIRVEELRILFFKLKYQTIQKSVFCLMSSEARSGTKLEENPFAIELESKVQKFRVDVGYYGIMKPKDFLDAFSDFKGSINDPEAIKAFQRDISEHFIPNIYQDNSDLQDSLVGIFMICDDMYRRFTDEQVGKKVESNRAKNLLRRLIAFGPRLEKSLQHGPITFGFLQHRNFLQWSIFVALRFFYGLFCCARPGGRTPLAPLQTETYGLLKGANALSEGKNTNVLKREICDLRSLHFATQESDMASLIFVVAFLIHVGSWSFMIIRLVELSDTTGDLVLDIGFFAMLPAGIGVIVTSFRLLRKLFGLIGIRRKLGRTTSKVSSKERGALQKARSVATVQILVTVLRLLSAFVSCLAMAWLVALRVAFMDTSSPRKTAAWLADKDNALWTALIAVIVALLANCISLIADYSMQYKLSSRLGEYICETNRKEIEKLYQSMSIGFNDVEPKLLQERRAWEYVALEFCHQHRFDLVLSAERFGTVFQYIQSGMTRGGEKRSANLESAPTAEAAASGTEVSLGE